MMVFLWVAFIALIVVYVFLKKSQKKAVPGDAEGPASPPQA